MPAFSLEPEQTAWAAELRALAADRLRPLAEKGEPGRVNRPLVAELGRLGLLSRLFTSGALDLCLMRESLAYACTEAETALALQGLGAHPVHAYGTPAQRARWLPRVADGTAIAAFALSEPGAGSDAAALVLRAEAEAGAGRPENPEVGRPESAEAGRPESEAATGRGAARPGFSGGSEPGSGGSPASAAAAGPGRPGRAGASAAAAPGPGRAGASAEAEPGGVPPGPSAEGLGSVRPGLSVEAGWGSGRPGRSAAAGPGGVPPGPSVEGLGSVRPGLSVEAGRRLGRPGRSAAAEPGSDRSLASGPVERLGAVDPVESPDPAHPRPGDPATPVAAAPDGPARWRLTGEKCWISNAPEADFYTVFARTTPGAGARGVTAFLVPADRPGLTGTALDMLSPHPIGSLAFDAVPVSADDVLGETDQGFRVAMGTLNLFRPSVGAFAVGMARAALDTTLAHTAQRDAFGGKLRDLQTVAHQVAEMALRTEAARLMVYAAATAYDEGAPDVPMRAAMAKLLATESAQYVVDMAVQLHGARALRHGHLLEHLYREVRAPRVYEGASEVQRGIIARELYANEEAWEAGA